MNTCSVQVCHVFVLVSPSDTVASAAAQLQDLRDLNVQPEALELAEAGPGLGRPLVDTIHGSKIANLKDTSAT